MSDALIPVTLPDELWARYEAAMLPPTLDATARRVIQAAFYSGMIRTVQIAMSGGLPPTFIDQLNAYSRALKEKAAANGSRPYAEPTHGPS